MSAKKKVTRYTRAGRDGKAIYCPCGKRSKVYHFAWSALKCSGCKRYVDKPAFLLSPPKKAKRNPSRGRLWYRNAGSSVYHQSTASWRRTGRAECGADIARPGFVANGRSQMEGRSRPCKRCLAKKA